MANALGKLEEAIKTDADLLDGDADVLGVDEVDVIYKNLSGYSLVRSGY